MNPHPLVLAVALIVLDAVALHAAWRARDGRHRMTWAAWWRTRPAQPGRARLRRHRDGWRID